MKDTLPNGTQLLTRFYHEFWNERRFEILDELVAQDCQLHFAEHSHSICSEKSRKVQREWVRSFPDLKFTVHNIVEEGDLSAVRLTFEGTHEEEFEGLAPTNKHIRVTEMLFAKVRDGKICEMWEDYDKLGMMQQLGYALSKPQS
ncbi:MAG TPA: ester cyclase [Nitrososphaerales archaeon]|nr:ester cyclase [Nitrososphaerales archaeon]